MANIFIQPSLSQAVLPRGIFPSQISISVFAQQHCDYTTSGSLDLEGCELCFAFTFLQHLQRE